MDLDLAIQILKALGNPKGLSTLEVLSMETIQTDGYLIFAVQKGDVTLLAWCQQNEDYLVLRKVQTVSW